MVWRSKRKEVRERKYNQKWFHCALEKNGNAGKTYIVFVGWKVNKVKEWF